LNAHLLYVKESGVNNNNWALKGQTTFEELVLITMETHIILVFITNLGLIRLMLLLEAIFAFSENQTKPMNAICVRCAELLDIAAGIQLGRVW
jgi:hypothetical protein